MPHVILKLYKGRSEDLKVKIANEVAKTVAKETGLSTDSVSVAIEEYDKDKWPALVYKNDILDKKDTIYKKPGYTMSKEQIDNSMSYEKNWGTGKVTVKHIIDEESIKDKNRLFAKVTLEKGASIGYHDHHGEGEVYYILQGKGKYNDNGIIREVNAGDTTFAGNNCGHSIENIGDNDLVFIALIVAM